MKSKIPRWLIWELNCFRYEQILREADDAVRLRIRIGEWEHLPWLELKHIELDRARKEVKIPEWLCHKRGLIDPAEYRTRRDFSLGDNELRRTFYG